MAFFSSLAVVLPAAATPASSLPPRRSSFRAAPVLLRVSSGKRRVSFSRATTASLSVRCKQSSKQGGSGSVVDVWASRLAMMSFAAAVVAEVSTGKGLVENFGVATPAPALALVVTALVVGLAVLFIVRSGSQD